MAVNDLKVARKEISSSRECLFIRATAGDLSALDRYFANGSNINFKDEDGLALIHYAACHGNIPLIRKLRELGADMNLRDDSPTPWKPIHYAIFHRKHEAEQLLRTLGAEVPLPILKRIAQEKSQGLLSDIALLSTRLIRLTILWRSTLLKLNG